MKRLIRNTILAGSAALLLLLAAIIVLPMLVDPNEHKAEISSLISEQTGREFTLHGDLELSVFPWLGVEVGRMELANAPGFTPETFARIDGARARVKLMPLFSRRIEVATISLHGLDVNLTVAADGRNNWADLTKPATAEPETTTADGSPAAAPALAALAIGGLEIVDGRIGWMDATSNTTIIVSHLNLGSGAVTPGQPFDLKGSLDLDSPTLKLSAHTELAARLTVDPQAGRYGIRNLSITTQASGDALPGKRLAASLATSIDADLDAQTVTVDRLTLESLGASVSANGKVSQLLGQPRFTGDIQVADFSPRTLLQALGQTPPDTADPKVLQHASLSLDIDVSATELGASKLLVRLDDTSLKGQAQVKEFAAPKIRFDAEIDSIDVDRYLPPPKGGEVVAATPTTAAGAAALNLPMETLRALEVLGKVRVGQLRASKLNIADIRLDMNASGGLIRIDPVEARLYQGKYQGHLALDARDKTPSFKIDESLAGVQAGPLLKDLMDKALISGTANIAIKAGTQGGDLTTLRQHLNGNARLSFTDGAVQGFNLAQMIREGRAKLQGQQPEQQDQPLQTDFTELSGSFDINDGIATNKDLQALSPYLRITGAGVIDLVKETIDYGLSTKIVGTEAGQGGAGRDELHGVSIPVKISGALSKPSIKLDQAQMAREVRERAKQQVDKKLEEKKTEVKEDIKQEREQLKQQLEEKLGDKLKGLFK